MDRRGGETRDLEVSTRECREPQGGGASFIVAFPAVYRDSLANGKRQNGGHAGTKSRPCRYRPRNVVRKGAVIKRRSGGSERATRVRQVDRSA